MRFPAAVAFATALVSILGGAAGSTFAAPALSCDTGDPAWSPDGRSIAFAGSSDPSVGWTIQVVDTAGTQVHALTQKPADDPPFVVWTHDFGPTWSTNGALLAYESGFQFWNPGYSHPIGGWQITVRALMSGIEWPAGQGLNPTWSSRLQLAWSTFEGPYNDPAGFVAGALVANRGASHPSWSPSGSRLVYDRDGSLWINRADGTGRPRRLTSGEDPHWSPDGRWIAYFRGDTLRLIDPQGHRAHALTLTRATEAEVEVEPVWSPDGSRIALGDAVMNVRTGGVRRLHVPLGDYPGQTWSPDGKLLAYAADTLTIVASNATTRRVIDSYALRAQAVNIRTLDLE